MVAWIRRNVYSIIEMAWDNSPITISWNGTPDGATSGAVDTSGKNFLVAVLAGLGSSADTPSDSKGNIWNPLTLQSANARVQIFYAFNATCGSGHTFTNTGASSYASCFVMAFSGGPATDNFKGENGSVSGSTATAQPGSVTPDSPGDLVVAGMSLYTVTDTPAIDTGFTVSGSMAYDGATHFSGAIAWKLQTGAVNPTWSWTTAIANIPSVIATFAAAPAGGGGASLWAQSVM